MTGYYLVDIFLVTGAVCFLSIAWLVLESILASKRVSKSQCNHDTAPEVVLVPMGGPMTPMAPPVKH
jgi:hypothetical protein